MKDGPMDPQRLAALIDGRLTPEERAEMLARMTASDEERDVFADTSAVLRELEAEDAADGPSAGPAPFVPDTTANPPSTSVQRPRRRMPHWGWGALAAGIVLAFALPAVMGRGPAEIAAPERTLALLAMQGDGFPSDWPATGDPVRGGGVSASGEAGVLASRLGVAHLHAAVAMAANDASAKADALADASELLRDYGPLSAAYARLSDPSANAADLAAVGAEAERELDAERFRLGAMAEAMRLAASRNSEPFFRSGDVASALQRASEIPDLPADAMAAVAELRSAVQSTGRPDWPSVQAASENLAAALTR